MPEGPEVKKIVNILNAKYANEIITHFAFTDKLKTNVKDEYQLPLTIVKIFSHGKRVIFHTIQHNNLPFYIVSSLGLKGEWVNQQTKNTKLTLDFKSNISINYNDGINYGFVDFMSQKSYQERILDTLGPCIINNMPDEKTWLNLFRKRPRKNICAALLDQNIVSGIGNYIKSECLYDSKVDPNKKIKALKDLELLNLRKSVIMITTEKSYIFQVYKRNTDNNNYQVIKKKYSGRVTYYVKEIQQ